MVKDFGIARYIILSAASFYFAGWNKHILYYKYYDIIFYSIFIVTDVNWLHQRLYFYLSFSSAVFVKAALFERLSEKKDHRYSHGTVWTCPCGAVSHDLSSGIPVLRLFTFTVYHLG